MSQSITISLNKISEIIWHIYVQQTLLCFLISSGHLSGVLNECQREMK